MAELTELLRVRQVPGDPRRRWFASVDLDLIVWCDDAGSPIAFQLCYDKPGSERALTWKPGTGFAHGAVDAGEDDAGLSYKATPILVAGGHCDAERIGALFAASSHRLPPAIAEFVASKLRHYASHVDRV